LTEGFDKVWALLEAACRPYDGYMAWAYTSPRALVGGAVVDMVRGEQLRELQSLLSGTGQIPLPIAAARDNEPLTEAAQRLIEASRLN
jgi:hypothetical protein